MADGQYTQFPIPFTTFDLEREINTLRDSMSNLESGVNTLEDSVESLENEKQNVLTAGGGITISGNTISTDNDTALTSATKPAQAKAVGDALSEIEEDLAKKANTDGAYEQMTVGNAEQLVSTTFVEDKVPYLFRTSGGSSDIGDREYDKIVGGTVAWNQLVQDGNFIDGTAWSDFQCSHSVIDGVATITPSSSTSRIFQTKSVVLDHKYLMMASFKGTSGEGNAILSWYGGKNKIVPFNGNWQNVALLINNSFQTAMNWQLYYGSVDNQNNTPYQIKNAVCFDLTQMFGATIADYLYSLEQSTPGAGIAKVKEWGFFREDYYEYDAGTLKSIEGLISHDMVGFNQWDEEWEVGAYSPSGSPTGAKDRICCKNYIPIFPDTNYYFKSPTSVVFALYADANKNIIGDAIQQIYPPNKEFTTPSDAHYMLFYLTAAYGSTYKNDVCINLVWSGSRNGEYEPYQKHTYALDSTLTLRGIPKLDSNGELYYDGDEYEHDGTVTRRYGIVDLGTLNWQTITDSYADCTYFATNAIPSKKIGAAQLICSKYATGTRLDRYKLANGQISNYNASDSYSVVIRDDSYTDAATFKTAMSGVKLVYELAEPTAEQATPFADPQIVNDWGTEEYVVSNPIIPIGHETRYTNNLRDKLQHLPDLAGSDGDYIVRQTGSQMYLIPYGEVKELPDVPETDGTYRLQLTVSGGTPTLAWVAE